MQIESRYSNEIAIISGKLKLLIHENEEGEILVIADDKKNTNIEYPVKFEAESKIPAWTDRAKFTLKATVKEFSGVKME